MNKLLIEPTPLAQWYTLVTQAHAAAPVSLNEAVESYLVYLLMRFTNKPQALQSILALDFLRGAHVRGAQRQSQLREVGDKCLLLSGMFPRRAARRCLRVSYFVDLGRTAYESISTRELEIEEELYNQLANSFVPMMDVLHTLRSLSLSHDDRQECYVDIRTAEDLWESTGSRFAYEFLQRNK